MCETNFNSNNDKTKECRFCKELIHEGAKRCKYCQSFQDWRRYLLLIATILSILVALISVTGIVVTKISDRISPEFANVDISFLNADESSINLSIYNEGMRPIKIGETFLTFRDVTPEGEYFSYFLLKLSENKIIKAESENDINLVFNKRIPTEKMIFESSTLQNIQREDCNLSIEVISFNEERKTYRKKIGDRKLDRFIEKWITKEP